MRKVCDLFLEELIPLFEHWFGDEWVYKVDYRASQDYLILTLPRFLAWEKLVRVRNVITSWFGDLLTSISDELHDIAVTFKTDKSGAMVPA